MAARADTRATEVGEIDDLTLARARRGEAAACTALVSRYERRVFALLSRMLAPAGLSDRVEDLAQETFLRVFRALNTFRPGGPARPGTWILTVATRLAIDELRRRRAEAAPLSSARELAAPDRADEVAMRRELASAVERAAAALSPEQRAALVLRFFHDLEYEEIAEALGCDMGTVKSRLSRARARMRQELRGTDARSDVEVDHG